MKKYLFILLAFAIVSCGASRKSMVYNTYTPNSQQTTITKNLDKEDECEKLSKQLSETEFRSYASSISIDKDIARSKAILLAKGQLVANIKSLVTRVANIRRGDISETTLQKVVVDYEENISEECEAIVTLATPICGNRYALSDGRYEYNVCIAVPRNTVENIISSISGEIIKTAGGNPNNGNIRDLTKNEINKFILERQQR